MGIRYASYKLHTPPFGHSKAKTISLKGQFFHIHIKIWISLRWIFRTHFLVGISCAPFASSHLWRLVPCGFFGRIKIEAHFIGITNTRYGERRCKLAISIFRITHCVWFFFFFWCRQLATRHFNGLAVYGRSFAKLLQEFYYQNSGRSRYMYLRFLFPNVQQYFILLFWIYIESGHEYV